MNKSYCGAVLRAINNDVGSSEYTPLDIIIGIVDRVGDDLRFPTTMHDFRETWPESV